MVVIGDFARAATFDLNGGNKVYNVFGSFSKREQRIIDILFLCLWIKSIYLLETVEEAVSLSHCFYG